MCIHIITRMTRCMTALLGITICIVYFDEFDMCISHKCQILAFHRWVIWRWKRSQWSTLCIGHLSLIAWSEQHHYAVLWIQCVFFCSLDLYYCCCIAKFGSSIRCHNHILLLIVRFYYWLDEKWWAYYLNCCAREHCSFYLMCGNSLI